MEQADVKVKQTSRSGLILTESMGKLSRYVEEKRPGKV